MNIVRDLSLENGSTVEIVKDNESIIIKPIRKLSAQTLIDGINESNLHSEVEWGKPEGNEIW